MKTYDIIVEQVSNAESLARAFTPQQWRAIIHYYRQNRGYGELTERHLNGWLRDCGSNMIESGKASSHTPGSWNRKATRYGGHIEVVGTPSWGDIYSHLNGYSVEDKKRGSTDSFLVRRKIRKWLTNIPYATVEGYGREPKSNISRYWHSNKTVS